MMCDATMSCVILSLCCWFGVKCGAMRMGGASCAISAYHHAVSACYMHPLLELAMGA